MKPEHCRWPVFADTGEQFVPGTCDAYVIAMFTVHTSNKSFARTATYKEARIVWNADGGCWEDYSSGLGSNYERIDGRWFSTRQAAMQACQQYAHLNVTLSAADMRRIDASWHDVRTMSDLCPHGVRNLSRK